MISDTISHHRSLIIPCLPCHFAALEHHASPVPWSEGMTLQCSGIRPTICRWIYPPWSGERSPFTVKNLFTASANFCLTVVTRDLKRCSKLQSISLFAICLRSFLGRAISCRSSRLCSFANNIHCSLLSLVLSWQRTQSRGLERSWEILFRFHFLYNAESRKWYYFKV